MVKSLDILIGFTVVLLVASMAVTVLTQIWTAMMNTRGSHLRSGLARLLAQIAAELRPDQAHAIAEHVLLHPMIREGERRLGTFVHRDELIRVLLEAASGKAAHRLPEDLRDVLRSALKQAGIEDACAVLHKIDEAALAIEKQLPALGRVARHEAAVLQAASSEFVARVNGWFELSMDRVSARFTLTTRRVTMINSIVIATVIHMDSVSLLNRLAGNEALRSSLVEKAYAPEKLSGMDPHQLALLAQADLFPVPAGIGAWRNQWQWGNFPGVALSVLLLSLGAPFWFEVLKNMLRLKSVIAGKRATGI